MTLLESCYFPEAILTLLRGEESRSRTNIQLFRLVFRLGLRGSNDKVNDMSQFDCETTALYAFSAINGSLASRSCSQSSPYAYSDRNIHSRGGDFHRAWHPSFGERSLLLALAIMTPKQLLLPSSLFPPCHISFIRDDMCTVVTIQIDGYYTAGI
ncbi:hypothetical protein BJV77DRAFT_559779 [Russula vinacea]|nr:hypothetical protein BJV77DRAFT_559779 [Russula vinacea]